MDKLILSILIAISSMSSAQDIESQLRRGPEKGLNTHEKKILKELEVLENSDSGRTLLKDGTVQYLFGYGIPTIPCKFMGSCEIVFEKGEIIENGPDSITMTDQRIQIVPMVKDLSGGTESLIVVTPLIDGVTTNIHVRTNRRHYKLKIKSTKRASFDRVAFRYKKDPAAALAAYQEEIKKRERKKKYDLKTSYDSRYEIKGDEPWKPQSVYFTGNKTVVNFREDYHLNELPVLYRLNGDTKEIIEYRVSDNKYIVDFKIDMAVLCLGSKEVQVIHKDHQPKEVIVKSDGFFQDEFF